jgi:VWFA-related protein
MKTRALLVCLAAWAALGQDPVFKATTRLVEVSVIAQDKDGKPVTDLRREEFQIFDNGSAQELRLFLTETEKPAARAAERQEPKLLTNRIASANGSRGGYSVLLFDNNTTPFEHTARARIKALEALRAIPAGDKIAIYSLWCKFQVIREFTADRESLLRQLDAFAPAAGSCGSGGGGDGFDAPGHASGEPGRMGALQRNSINDDEIQAMADHLAGIPGRKNLIWLAANFHVGREALRKLIDAGVAVYPVDAIGSTIGLESDKKAHNAPLLALAAITGGVAYFDRDDLDVAVREALDDGRFGYTLGFYQTGEDTKAMVHQIGVRVSRPEVTLRYGSSYETEARRAVAADPVADMVRAMNGPVDATAIGIDGSATRVQERLDVKAKFELSGLDLALDQGLWKGQVEVVARFMTAQATQAGDALAETVTLKLKPETYQAMLANGLPYQKELNIPAKAVELKLLIGNLASGKIGTLTIPLPNVNGQ